MRNRLLTLCMLLYPPAQRAADGEMLRDLADELAEDHGVTKEAVGLARGGFRARFEHHRHRVGRAPWGEALRQLALPFTVLSVAPIAGFLVFADTYNGMPMSLFFTALSLLFTLIGVTAQWRAFAALGVTGFAVATMNMGLDLIVHGYFDPQALPYLVAHVLDLAVLTSVVFALPRYRTQSSDSSRGLVRLVSVSVVLCVFGLNIFGLIPNRVQLFVLGLVPSTTIPVVDWRSSFEVLALVLCQVLLVFGAFIWLFSMRRKPSRALAAASALAVFFTKEIIYCATVWFKGFGVYVVAAVMLSSSVVFLLFIAGKTSDIAAKKSIRSVGI